LNRARAEARVAVRGEQRALAASAVAALRWLVKSTDSPPAIRSKAALAVLTAVGADRPEVIGSTDPAEVRCESDERASFRALRNEITAD
jgi:hypothetical protein